MSGGEIRGRVAVRLVSRSEYDGDDVSCPNSSALVHGWLPAWHESADPDGFLVPAWFGASQYVYVRDAAIFLHDKLYGNIS